MIGKCSICGEVLRSHKSDKHTAKHNFLSVLRTHYWKKHRSTMVNRIRLGKQRNKNNPIIQEFAKSLSDGVISGLNFYRTMTKKQYQYTRKVMEYIGVLLTPEQMAAWQVIKNIGDQAYGY